LITGLVADGILFFRLLLRSRTSLSAAVLFLRKQLASYEEWQVQPRPLNDSARFSLIVWSRLCNWKEALVIVKPETLIGRHRKGFKLFWKGKSQASRPMFLHVLCVPIGLPSRRDGATGGPLRRTGACLSAIIRRTSSSAIPGCGDHSISNSLCVHPHGGWCEAHRALKHHRVSNGSLDLTKCEARSHFRCAICPART
jgi:hypothetical protein